MRKVMDRRVVWGVTFGGKGCVAWEGWWDGGGLPQAGWSGNVQMEEELLGCCGGKCYVTKGGS